ncbi:nucleoside-diphosphate kinase, partial [Cetobacterium sp.]
GSTSPVDAVPGTIRGDFSMDTLRNIVHTSDSVETSTREIKNFFKNID